ncbi:MliC family protein [Glaciimonas soli]|uniref:Membrane-bound lysozyme inhibitor of c-type lysozyme MliC n=1 Tax=Glaciimonas soli TaxID=2590999 RepID=A0A843YNZ8_9BURK|nr:MliC family protein [Glaciimonas soli]MQR01559.1 hypothetical protein [Glaciimonas soli]
MFAKFPIFSVMTATLLLSACGSSVPLTETRPALAAVIPGIPSPSLHAGKYSCESGSRVEIQQDDRGAVQLIWLGRAYVMTPVVTSTGAVRLENAQSGLVWIQIPAKSMLLNTKQSSQLANGCNAG